MYTMMRKESAKPRITTKTVFAFMVSALRFCRDATQFVMKTAKSTKGPFKQQKRWIQTSGKSDAGCKISAVYTVNKDENNIKDHARKQ